MFLTAVNEFPVFAVDERNGAYSFDVYECTPAAIDFEYAKNGLPVFWKHGGPPVGLLTDCRIVDGNFCGDVVFMQTPLAQELQRLTSDLRLRGASIECEIVKRRPAGKWAGLPLYHVTKWIPFAVALTPTAANQTTGVERLYTPSRLESGGTAGAGDKILSASIFDPVSVFTWTPESDPLNN